MTAQRLLAVSARLPLKVQSHRRNRGWRFEEGGSGPWHWEDPRAQPTTQRHFGRHLNGLPGVGRGNQPDFGRLFRKSEAGTKKLGRVVWMVKANASKHEAMS